MDDSLEYRSCALFGVHPDLIGECDGRVTREHAIYFANRQLQELWAIPPICAKHHGVDLFQDRPGQAPKEVRAWVALNRATDDQLRTVSKAIDYVRERERLNAIYGEYVPQVQAAATIAY